MTENSRVTGKVFTKLFFSFVVVLFLGMAVLDFSLRQVMEQSLRTQAEESLASQARILATQLSTTAPPDSASLQQIARSDAAAAWAEVEFYDAQGRLIAASGKDAALNQDAGSEPPPEVAAVLQKHQSQARARRGETIYVAVPAGSLVVRLAVESPTNVAAAVHVLRRGILV